MLYCYTNGVDLPIAFLFIFCERSFLAAFLRFLYAGMYFLQPLISGVHDHLGFPVNMHLAGFIQMIIVPPPFAYLGADDLLRLLIHYQLRFQRVLFLFA